MTEEILIYYTLFIASPKIKPRQISFSGANPDYIDKYLTHDYFTPSESPKNGL
ncbi:hypothetical protein GYA13_02355 [Candidatus Kuenenbacteria bacterium]|nr:hypothetical protein [Candidatus Kuenenbacteria bacterium]